MSEKSLAGLTLTVQSTKYQTIRRNKVLTFYLSLHG